MDENKKTRKKLGERKVENEEVKKVENKPRDRKIKDIRFEAQYKETKEVLTKVCTLYHSDKADINFRMVAFIFVPFVVLVMYINGSFAGGTTSELVVFFVKAIVAWVASFFVAKICSRTLGKKYAELSGRGDAEELFNRRISLRKGELLDVYMCFGEESFQNITKTLTKTYRYANVTRLIENDDSMAIVVLNPETGEKGLHGFPKDTLTNGDADTLRTFLEERCPGAKKGFIKY
ncbi:MAG: hypothetical protein ACI4S2_09880 [Lachnospiraceae bacterium]